MTLGDLQSIDEFNVFEKYITKFFLSSNDLLKMVYYPQKNPLIQEDLENPYAILDDSRDNEYGIVLFRRKLDTILNSSKIIVLIDFECVQKGNSQEYDNIYIIIRIISKGTEIQKLENGLDRNFVIAQMIDNNLNLARVNGLGEVKKKSMGYMATNEENTGYILIYTATSFSSNLMNNKNFQKRIKGDLQ